MRHKIYQLVVGIFLMLGGASFAYAGFIGRELSAEYFYTDLATSYGPAIETPSTFVVGIGVETIVRVEGVTSIASDFSDSSLQFEFSTSLSSPTWGGALFNGLVFNVVGGAPLSLISASIDPNSTLAGFDSSRITFSNSQVAINWQGLSYNTGTILRINFESTEAQVPEPATMSLVGLGLLGIVAFSRKSSK